MVEHIQCINPYQPDVAFHMETSRLIFRATQMTGLDMKSNTCLKWVNLWTCNPDNIYLFKVNNKNTRKRYAICSKLTIKRRH